MKIPVFPNLGNTCYVNSVLQCFVYNEKLKQNTQTAEQTPLILEFNKLTSIIDTSENGEYLAIFYNLNNFINLLPFKRFEQQDAHEFILYLLDKLNLKLFYGTTQTDIHCLKCQTVKNVYEEFNSINLTIPLENSNLTNLIVNYFEIEVHTNEDNLYFCETCNCLTSYSKKIILHILPETLIIVLKRYTETGCKIISEVEIDNVLNIKESSTGNIKVYNLTSTINHIGNLYNGHYTNYINKNRWMHVDDQFVKVEPFNGKDAYILFYSS